MGRGWRGETGALGSLPASPLCSQRTLACMHTRTTNAVNRPCISRAQQPPLEGTSHKRPLGQMPFPCDSCHACRNQLLLLQLLMPSLSWYPSPTTSRPSPPPVSSPGLDLPPREPPALASRVVLDARLHLLSPNGASAPTTLCTRLLSLLGFERGPPGTALPRTCWFCEWLSLGVTRLQWENAQSWVCGVCVSVCVREHVGISAHRASCARRLPGVGSDSTCPDDSVLHGR